MKRRIQRFLFLGALIMAAAVSSASAAVYYVSPAGSDTNPGTIEAPWRTLQRAANSVAAGDMVIVRAGQYTGFDLRTDGAAANPITFRADPGVVIDAPNPVTPNHGINLEGADYIVVEGFTVTGMPRAGIRSVLNHHVTIRNNTADLNSLWGIFTGFSDDLLIENNVATRSAIEHGIYVSNSGDRPVIRRNLVWGNRANGIHMNGDLSQGGDGIISGALVEQNTVYENGLGGGSGINADGVQNSRFQNNLLYNNHASGVSLYRIDGGDGSKNNIIVNNTIVQAADARWAINIKNGSTGNTVVNNILYSDHAWRGSINILGDSLPGFTSDYNVVMERFSIDDGASVLNLSQWQAATGQDRNSIVATPPVLFVNAGSNDYHLSATSPAIDIGTSLQAPAVDRDGNPRPSGDGWDIGAYESPRFLDVPPSHPFYSFITTIARHGITSGCGGGNFCPDSSVTRDQMAVFLLRGKHGGSYLPPPATGSIFNDVPITAFAAAFIEQLFTEGITSGCSVSPPLYCPEAPSPAPRWRSSCSGPNSARATCPLPPRGSLATCRRAIPSRPGSRISSPAESRRAAAAGTIAPTTRTPEVRWPSS